MVVREGGPERPRKQGPRTSVRDRRLQVAFDWPSACACEKSPSVTGGFMAVAPGPLPLPGGAGAIDVPCQSVGRQLFSLFRQQQQVSESSHLRPTDGCS